MLCAAESSRDDRGTFTFIAPACHYRTLTDILERRAQFTSRERHQVKMTILALLYMVTPSIRSHLAFELGGAWLFSFGLKSPVLDVYIYASIFAKSQHLNSYDLVTSWYSADSRQVNDVKLKFTTLPACYGCGQKIYTGSWISARPTTSQVPRCYHRQ